MKICFFIISNLLLSLALADPWKSIPPTRTPPAPRQLSRIVIDDDLAYIFGGLDPFNAPIPDLWTLNLTSYVYQQLPSLSDVPHSEGCLWKHGPYLFQYGGVDSVGSDSDVLYRWAYEQFVWTPISTSISPGRRRRSSCTTIEVNGKEYGFLTSGGSLSGFLADIWLLDFESATWHSVTILSDDVFSTRQLPNIATLPFHKSSVLLFSGRTHVAASATQSDKNDTWLITINQSNDSDLMTFTADLIDLTPCLNGSFGTYLTSTLFDDSGNFIIIGGWLRDKQQSSDKIQVLRTFNSLDFNQWYWVSYKMSNEIREFAVDSTVSVIYGNQIIVFGGYFDIGVLNTLFLIETDSFWTNDDVIFFQTLGDHFAVPPSVASHQSVTIASKIYFTGGFRQSSSSRETSVYYFDLDFQQWSFQEVTSSFVAPILEGHCLLGFGSRLISFGGRVDEVLTSEVYVFNTLTAEWTVLETFGERPTPRAFSCCARHFNLVYVYGGQTSGGLSDSLYTLNLPTGEWKLIDIHPSSHIPPPLDSCGLVTIAGEPSYLALLGGRSSQWTANQDYIYKLNLDDSTENIWFNQSLVFISPSIPTNSFTPIVFGDNVFLFGGVMWDAYVGRISFLKLGTLSDTDPIKVLNFEYFHDHLFESLSFSTAAIGNSVFVFGGSRVASSLSIDGFGTNTLFERQFTCNDFTTRGLECTLDCQPGSRQTTNSSNGNLCEPCDPGYYGTSTATGSVCLPCPRGFYSTSYSAVGIESCIPCEEGTYQPYRGSFECFPCNLDDFCPVGSTFPMSNMSSYSRYGSLQPSLPDDNVSLVSSVSLTILSIGSFLAISITVFAFILGKRASKILPIDIFSRSHYVELDSVIIRRKTKLGRLFTCWFILITLGLVAVLLTQFVFDNHTYLRTMEPTFLIDENFEFNTNISLLVQGYQGVCLSSFVNLDFSSMRCEKTLTSTSFVAGTNTSNCLIDIRLKKCLLTSVHSSLEIALTDPRAFAFSLDLNVSSSSSLPFGHSVVSSHLNAPVQMLFRGSHPTVFRYEAIKSLFIDHSRDSSQQSGYHLNLESREFGDLVSSSDFAYNSGLSVLLIFDESPFVLITELRDKETLASFFSNALGASAGVTGAVGFVLSLVEILFQRYKFFFKRLVKDNATRLDPFSNPLYQAAFELEELKKEP
ncbi:hypothetical protein P9112_003966 [Eukaryota sp. TZLM1-RC]